MQNRFRSVAVALRPYVSDTYALIEAADAVVSLDDSIERPLPTITTPDGKATWDWTYNRWNFQHADLVDVVLNNSTIMGHMFDSKKINAIKELRAVAKCGLKEAKDAVEDERVSAALADPWNPFHPHEPPF